ncbi:hypothetical protein PAPYR_6560 [Paratrimastix pyriformis]|uniref:N-acetyltransferase domain-containing protein n=1 Tax=Paratrimastix pyriformis TaxID=342808 RepID=A0ABQ8UHG9_9EUKA|nr:hypothetical protein PAPYR_6560 [Paratrimastix pyriformis]
MMPRKKPRCLSPGRSPTCSPKPVAPAKKTSQRLPSARNPAVLRLDYTQTVRSPRLILRPPKMSDIHHLHSAYQEDWTELSTWFEHLGASTTPPSLRQTEALLRKDIRCFTDGKSYRYHLFLKEGTPPKDGASPPDHSSDEDEDDEDDDDEGTGVFVGACGFSRVSWSAPCTNSEPTMPPAAVTPPATELIPTFELAYWLRPTQRHKGLAVEACNALIDFLQHRFAAQRNLGVSRFQAEIRCRPENAASVALARRLGGFSEIPQTGGPMLAFAKVFSPARATS